MLLLLLLLLLLLEVVWADANATKPKMSKSGQTHIATLGRTLELMNTSKSQKGRSWVGSPWSIKSRRNRAISDSVGSIRILPIPYDGLEYYTFSTRLGSATVAKLGWLPICTRDGTNYGVFTATSIIIQVVQPLSGGRPPTTRLALGTRL